MSTEFDDASTTRGARPLDSKHVLPLGANGMDARPGTLWRRNVAVVFARCGGYRRFFQPHRSG